MAALHPPDRVSRAPPHRVGNDDGVSAYPTPMPVDPTDVGGKRLVAALIDVGIGTVISIVLFIVLSDDTYRYNRASNGIVYSRELQGIGAVLFYGAWLAYNVGVFVLQRGLTGKTLGTITLGLVTVNAQGQPLGPGRALVRSVAGIVDYIPCCAPLVGIITIFTTKDHRRVGDMAASSYVVEAQWFGSPVGGPGASPAGYAAAPTPPMSAAPGAAWTPPPPVWGNPPTASAAPAPLAAGAPSLGPPLFGAGPAPTAPPSGPAPSPQWDPNRGAYVTWDPQRQQWLQFDQASQQWMQYDAVTAQWRPVTR